MFTAIRGFGCASVGTVGLGHFTDLFLELPYFGLQYLVLVVEIFVLPLEGFALPLKPFVLSLYRVQFPRHFRLPFLKLLDCVHEICHCFEHDIKLRFSFYSLTLPTIFRHSPLLRPCR